MGPEPSSSPSGNLPSRPKFKLDLKNVPWTDGKGPQEEYAEEVKAWSAFHDLLPDTISNKLDKKLRGTIPNIESLNSQCYGRAKELVKSVPQDLLSQDDGWKSVVNAIHKIDPLQFVSDVYLDFNTLLAKRHGQNENMCNFETRFEAQVSRFNAHNACSIPDALLALMLLGNSNIDDNQRVSILAAAVSNVSPDESDEATVADMLGSVKYASIASVLRQCERKKSAIPQGNGETINAHQTHTLGGCRHRGKYRQHKTPEQIAELRKVKPCHYCKKQGLTKYGHWSADHNENGTVKPGAISSDTPIGNSTNCDGDQGNGGGKKKSKVAIGFTSTLLDDKTLKCNIASPDCSDLKCGPLVDDGAPYSAIGINELQFLVNKSKPSEVFIDEKPEDMSRYDFWQYGSGSHSSQKRKILGSTVLYVKSDNGNKVSIRHLVIDGSSHWVVGRNLTRK